MGYEVFTAKRTTKNNPSIAILKSGSIFFNRSFCNDFLKNETHFNLLYDKEKQLIGIQAIDKKEAHSYFVRDNTGKTGFGVSAVSFLKHYSIDYKETRRYSATWNKQLNLAEVKIG